MVGGKECTKVTCVYIFVQALKDNKKVISDLRHAPTLIAQLIEITSQIAVLVVFQQLYLAVRGEVTDNDNGCLLTSVFPAVFWFDIIKIYLTFEKLTPFKDLKSFAQWENDTR